MVADKEVRLCVPIGHVIVNKRIVRNKEKVGYFYRETPDNDKDSGWRFFTGTETQEYADNADNFMLYKASKLVEIHPEIEEYLLENSPVEFEWDGSKYVKI
ncbi:DUF2185 domain-containing protein [Grimontia kaedaensis]|uniref:DUF2185 domain-containing protein n=1 Tax=Grimontia kaedaensis TaxID=2872157 RepID=A0ABY4WXP2_9GAMM|nr:DUF2185 domain-containing protein [Grimontia kaedaensis]USH03743.1 DUF2185 domain-containing protein [Grimontia kaedaensis]